MTPLTYRTLKRVTRRPARRLDALLQAGALKGIDSTTQVSGYHGSHRAQLMPNALATSGCC